LVYSYSRAAALAIFLFNKTAAQSRCSATQAVTTTDRLLYGPADIHAPLSVQTLGIAHTLVLCRFADAPPLLRNRTAFQRASWRSPALDSRGMKRT